MSVAGLEWQNGRRRPTLLALHGGPGLDGSKLRVQLAAASAYAQVVVPDQRGHGHSDMGEPSDWNLDRWADDVAEVVDILGLERPVVFGTSFGGFVVQRYLARHPAQPGGAVLSDTMAREIDRSATVERFRQVGGDVAAEVVARGFRENTLEAEREWAEVCESLLRRHPASPEVQEAAAQRIRTPEVNLYFTPSLSVMDLRPGLAGVQCPVLVMNGEHDPLIPAEAALEIMDALPVGIGEHVVIADAAHDVLNDQPEATHSHLEDFVSRCGIP